MKDADSIYIGKSQEEVAEAKHIVKVKAESARRVVEEEKVYKRMKKKKGHARWQRKKSWMRMLKEQIVNSLCPNSF